MLLPGVSVVLGEGRAGNVQRSQTVRAEKGSSPTTVSAVLGEHTVLDVARDSAHVTTRKEDGTPLNRVK